MKDNSTVETITVTDPDGNEHDVDIRIFWSDFERNPMGKEDRVYRSEDDGRTVEAVELV